MVVVNVMLEVPEEVVEVVCSPSEPASGVGNVVTDGIEFSARNDNSSSETYKESSSCAINTPPMAARMPTVRHARQHDTAKTKKQLRMLSPIVISFVTWVN